jgi:hypothetical protein
LLEYREASRRIVHGAVGERGGDDIPIPIDAQVQFAPAAALVRGLVLVSLPLPVTKHLQTSRVDDQMKRATVTPGQVRDLNTAMTP